MLGNMGNVSSMLQTNILKHMGPPDSVELQTSLREGGPVLSTPTHRHGRGGEVDMDGLKGAPPP